MTISTAHIGTLQVPEATIHYELRGSGPLLVLHAAPMTAESFAPVAERLASRYTVLTSDPRGIGGSTVDDPTRDVTPGDRADDLARLLDHFDEGPALLFGSSGGAVSALTLVANRPDLVSMVVAHEPPLATLLADCGEIRVATDDMIETYLGGDRLGYWRQFLAMAAIPMPDDVVDMVFGGPMQEQALSDEQFAVVHMDRPTTFWPVDVTALRASGVRLCVGVGEDSAGQLCDRTSRALASLLGLEPTMFAGDHIGFVHDPDGFTERLVDVFREDS